MNSLYPLRFEPTYRRYIWGGRRLQSVLDKQLPAEGEDYAESWEVVDHGVDQSVVASGHLAGWTLGELVRERGEELLGRHHPQPCFPLLFKFLDCQRDLSVQVHPNDAQGAQLDPPDRGKTEAWVILSAEPGSCLYAGLQAGVDHDQLEHALAKGTVENLLHRVEPQVGDCFFIPAGTIHALGHGLLVAEIQQSSNTTFRLFDWNRLGADGQPRPLHIEQGLAVTDFSQGPIQAAIPQQVGQAERLVDSQKFVLNRYSSEQSIQLGGDNRCHIIATLAGQYEGPEHLLRCGETILLPASHEGLRLEPSPDSILLDMYLPDELANSS